MGIIYTRKGEEILVDDEDYKELNAITWHITAKGYVARSITKPKRTMEYMHRRIMGEPKGFLVDHKSRIKTDNRRDNLRVCTNRQNQCNHKLSAANTAGYKGVKCRIERSKKNPYYARIMVRGKEIQLGRFKTAEEAARAYDCAAILYNGEFASTNKSLGLLL